MRDEARRRQQAPLLCRDTGITLSRTASTAAAEILEQ